MKLTSKMITVFLILALTPLFSSTLLADDHQSQEQQISLSILGGFSSLSNADPVSTAVTLGSDIRFGINDKFGLGATFSHAFGSARMSNSSTDVSQNITFFGVNPYYGIHKASGVSASVGLVLGAILSSTSTDVGTGAGTSTKVSASKFALGLNAAVDIPVVGDLFFTLVPQYFHSVGSGNNMGVASIRIGFGYSL